jgi:hypothetical protein
MTMVLLINFLFSCEQKLADLSTVANARLIDGILLTKFDTIDDKVCIMYKINTFIVQFLTILQKFYASTFKARAAWFRFK